MAGRTDEFCRRYSSKFRDAVKTRKEAVMTMDNRTRWLALYVLCRET